MCNPETASASQEKRPTALGPNRPGHGGGNKDALARVALALIDNAINNADEGTSEVMVEGDGRSGTLIVRDPGRGIDNEGLPHIFERFYRGDKSRNAIGGGFGFGLAIAKETIELHHGAIHVESTPGSGAVCCVLSGTLGRRLGGHSAPGTSDRFQNQMVYSSQEFPR